VQKSMPADVKVASHSHICGACLWLLPLRMLSSSSYLMHRLREPEVMLETNSRRGYDAISSRETDSIPFVHGA
jgi:hypothetical protein